MNEQDYVLATQAGFVKYELEDYTDSGNDIRFSRFVKLIRADEREEILKMSELQWFKGQTDYDAAIRARSNK